MGVERIWMRIWVPLCYRSSQANAIPSQGFKRPLYANSMSAQRPLTPQHPPTLWPKSLQVYMPADPPPFLKTWRL